MFSLIDLSGFEAELVDVLSWRELSTSFTAHYQDDKWSTLITLTFDVKDDYSYDEICSVTLRAHYHGAIELFARGEPYQYSEAAVEALQGSIELLWDSL
jgi:hypothetical protein